MAEFQVSPPPDPSDGEEDKTATAFSVSENLNVSTDSLVGNSSIDVPLDTRTEITIAELPDRICTQCLEDNLIRGGVIETFVTCQKCGEEFCIHGVSKLDPQYCIHCCNDFKVVDVVEQAQRPIYNKDGGLIAVRQFKVRHITLSGLHWLFFNRAITSLSDIELEHAIEYHMSIYHGMIYERESRRVLKSHRNKGKVAGNESRNVTQNPFEATQDGVTFTLDGSPSRAKKVRTKTIKMSQSGVKSTKIPNQETINALIKTLMDAGLTQEQILAMGKK